MNVSADYNSAAYYRTLSTKLIQSAAEQDERASISRTSRADAPQRVETRRPVEAPERPALLPATADLRQFIPPETAVFKIRHWDEPAIAEVQAAHIRKKAVYRPASQPIALG
jgi:hypothetical protein